MLLPFVPPKTPHTKRMARTKEREMRFSQRWPVSCNNVRECQTSNGAGMRLEHLREFIVLAELCNFTKASEQLFVTQSALTRHIAALESEMGVRLLDRTTRGVALTPMGRRSYQVFSDMLAHYDSLLGDVSSYLSGLSGTLRVGMLYYAIADYCSPVLDAFSQRHPNIEVKLESGQPRDIERWLRERTIDVGLQTVPPSDQDDDQGFLEIERLPYVALVRPDHPFARRASIAASELAEEKVVVYGHDKVITSCIMQSLELSGVRPAATVDAGQVDGTPLSVIRENAVGVVAANLRSTYTGLAAVDIADETMRASVGYAYRRSNDNPVLAAFLHTVAEVFPDTSGV